MNITKWILVIAASLALSASLAGCGGMNKLFEDKPPKVSLKISATPDVNPDMNGRPSPIVVRIFGLSSDDIFNNADFFALYENERSILGDTVRGREEVEISPGDTIEMDKEYDLETTHVGVLAAYRDLDNAVWRGTIVTPINKKTNVDIMLQRLTLSVRPGNK